MSDDIAARVDAWLAHCPHPAVDPHVGMAEAGLLAPAASYAEIAQTKAAIIARTGLPGLAGIWGGPQMVARWFIAGFGSAAQQATWRGRAAAVAISEPRVGAHPKLLTTRAIAEGDCFRISGEKAWVSNGPSADVFVVLAITAEREGRKSYSMFLVPHDAPGLTLQEMPGFDALHPSRHCGLLLRNVLVPRTALLGPEGRAYETMALPFRDIEDAVGTFTLLGCFRFLRARLLAGGVDQEQAAAVGAVTALIAVFAEAAEAVVAALDAGGLETKSAVLAGLHVLAADLAARLRACSTADGATPDIAVQRLLTELDVLLSIARGPRQARLTRLAVTQ